MCACNRYNVGYRMKRSGSFICRIAIYLLISGVLLVCAESEAKVGDNVELDLKNSGRIMGTIKQETDGAIVLDMGFGTMTISKDDIEKVEVLDGEIVRDQFHKRSKKSKDEQERAWRERMERNRQIKEENVARKRRATKHKIKFDNETRILVDVTIDGNVETQLILDTGAALVVISPETAKKAGYLFRGASVRDSIDLMMADGSRTKGTPVTLGSVEVAGVKAEKVGAVIAERGEAAYGLLGMSFLKNFNVRIDSENKELILKEL